MNSADIAVTVVMLVLVLTASLLAPAPKAPPAWAAAMAARRRSLRERWQRRRPLLLLYLLLVAVATIVLVVWVLPSILTEHPRMTKPAERHTAIANARTSLVAMLAAIGAAGGLGYTARTYRLSREGHITDRYSKAVEQLGSEKMAVRLGGIFALERLMRDSPTDQPTIMETLAAYVREHAALPRPPRAGTSEEPLSTRGISATSVEGEHPHRPVPDLIYVSGDVQAVLTVLGRRHPIDDERPINLELTNLTGARLDEANLTRANLSQANLTKSWLRSAQLTDSLLVGTDLSSAALDDANLTGARLNRASLTGASLNRADLTGVWLFEANLTGAKLDYANLTRVLLHRGSLSAEQLAATPYVDGLLWFEKLPPPP